MFRLDDNRMVVSALACVTWGALLIGGTFEPFDGALPSAAAVAVLGALGVLAPPLTYATWIGIAVIVTFDLALVPWALSAALAQLLLTRRASAHAIPVRLDTELQRQLLRCRRRDERAAILVAGASGQTPALDELLASLRATDAFEVAHDSKHWELRAVLDGNDLDREAVERRVARAAGDAGVQFGWAEFPFDGMTLEVLVEKARTATTAPNTAPSMATAGH
jgi:hypothetical protein